MRGVIEVGLTNNIPDLRRANFNGVELGNRKLGLNKTNILDISYLEMPGVDESAGAGPEQHEDQPGQDLHGGGDHPHPVHHRALAHRIRKLK